MFRNVLPIVAALVFVSHPAQAAEGMWTFDNFPFAKAKAATGIGLDQAWLDHVRGAAVRLSSGCSASVVSKDGLVVTNHHCVSTCVQDLSTAQQDYVKAGFFTAARSEERACPGLQAEIVVAINDVTAAINAATVGQSGDNYARARDRAMAEAEQTACGGDRRRRCQTLSFYGGREYKLYAYRRYEDVRLVFAPETDIAFFGGDPDNFNFPRYDLDAAFIRLYENGRTVSTPDHLVWSTTAPTAGEAVFIAGNPGTTNRAMTMAQLYGLRDVVFPLGQPQRAELRGRLIEYGRFDTEKRRVVQDMLLNIENGYKSYAGQQQALTNPAFMAVKQREEADLKARVAADPALFARIGDPWAEIERAQLAYADRYAAYRALESNAGNGSTLYDYARTLVRVAKERDKPRNLRRAAYADSRLPLIERDLMEPAPIDAGLEQLLLEFWLSKAREALTADHPAVKAMLGDESPEGLAERLIMGSTLADAAKRRVLWNGGLSAVKASSDPLIQFVLRTDGMAQAERDAWSSAVTTPTDRAQERLAEARYAIYGDEVYPDANFALRLSFGRVEGWTYRGLAVPPVTTLGGLYQRATGQFPYELTQAWLDAKPALNLDTVFNISSSNDIVGGNSGSPLINANGLIVGVVFDGNIHSLGGAYGYDPLLNRAVTVSTAAVTEALTKVYKRSDLAAELTAR